MSVTSWEIMQLDENIKIFGTLRKHTMTIMSKNKPSEHLFLSVDTSFFRSNEVIFSFLPRHETEARMFVGNIVPYFQHKYNEATLRDIFLHNAILRASQSIWNADLQEVTSPADLYLEQSGDIPDNFDIMEIMGVDTISETQNQTNSKRDEHRVERLFTEEDDTSAGTLFTKERREETQLETTATLTSNISTANRSVGTSLTTEEVEKRMTLRIKLLMHQLLQQKQNDLISNPNIDTNMELEKESTQPKADDSRSESVCRNK
jgi:hypothetical protein